MTALRPICAVLFMLLLAGCGTSAAHNQADVAFATGMLPHHQQAVQMSDVLLAKSGVDADVVALATQIKAEQAPEIEQLRGWLSTWGAGAGTGEMGGMDGMMSPEEMEALDSAAGPAAQDLFLRGMVRHHQGAIAMARTEVAQGEDADAKTLARSIITSQQGEIDEMNELLGR